MDSQTARGWDIFQRGSATVVFPIDGVVVFAVFARTVAVRPTKRALSMR